MTSPDLNQADSAFHTPRDGTRGGFKVQSLRGRGEGRNGKSAEKD